MDPRASQRALREVQDRHEDIKRIERTLITLAKLFNDVCSVSFCFTAACLNPIQMSVLVEDQNEQFVHIEGAMENVKGDTQNG